ncbi:hypothetical protein [Candidatus Oscillochloris fontis]|uniref:hypothetical protein n=1 Tax=Candidatus Oscillochloris fontis TaxID=2496868 RepID=UPI00101DD3BF|nr:hypothetical protein [Candidatus Oscillochloris fontis]
MNSSFWQRRWWSFFAVIMVVLVSLPALPPQVADASATGCRVGGGGKFCFKVDGTGKYVRTVTFERFRTGRICDPNVTVLIKDNNGYVIPSNIPPYSQKGCWTAAYSVKINIDQRFPDNASQICGQWRENGYFSEVCHRMK